MFEFIRMPDSTGFGNFTESGQVVPAIDESTESSVRRQLVGYEVMGDAHVASDAPEHLRRPPLGRLPGQVRIGDE